MVEGASVIPIARPWIGEEEAQAARRVILSGWVTQGPEVAAFEREFAEYVGAPRACAVSNCTVALFMALKAVGVSAGDDVITVSHSFIASANSIRHLGARPVFVDIEPRTYTIDPSRIEAVVTPRTRAILAVHQIGMPCSMGAILAVARQHGLPVVEDAACAVGSEIDLDGWEKIGRPQADVACFSFHPRKLLTTGDGGMLTTANPALDEKFRLWRQHAMSVGDSQRHTSPTVVFESYGELGYNFRMTDIQAAVGREQLKRMPAIITRRREQARAYRGLLVGIPGGQPPWEPTWARTNWQSYCFMLPPGTEQRDVMQRMLDRGISTRRGITNAHREAAYPPGTWTCAPPSACECGASCRRLKHSEEAQDRGLLLPLFHDMTWADQERVAQALQEAL